MALVDFEIRDRIAIVTIDNPPVNALSRAVRVALLEAFTRAKSEPAVAAVILRCAGRTFIAGADIREFDAGLAPPHTPDVVAHIEGLGKPVVAILHGTTLGGGLEIALGCHYRIAADDAQLGFPEVRLGLIPGASGTQRLPRLVGIEAALDLMISGRPIDAPTAHVSGLVDAIAPADELYAEAMDRAQALAASGESPRQIRELAVAPVHATFFDEYREAIAKRTRGQFAPECIVRSVERALVLPFDDAVRAERELFISCMNSPQSLALRYVFFAERRAAKGSADVDGVCAGSIETIAIVGAGTMGAGIAAGCLGAGYRVILQDIDAQRLEQAAESIQGILSQPRYTARGSAPAASVRLERLGTTADLQAVDAADLVIEAVFEDLDLKREVFAQLDSICAEGAILATNTSTLDVDAIAAATARPHDVIGLHFFSPANVMPLVEIVRGKATSAQTIATGLALAKRLQKVGVVVGNCHGFVGNRLFHGYGREAQQLLLEGALPDQIDQALFDWGMAMGPHAVGDLAGLDVGYRIRQMDRDRPDDPAYFRIADRLAEAGRYGQKTGAGMYHYEPGTRVPLPDADVAKIISREASALGVLQRNIGTEEIVERCIYALIVAGARVLEEGVAQRPGDIDVIWVNGYGFPRHRGGPMHYADTIGLGGVYAKICEFRDRLGTRYWAPPMLLADLAHAGRSFADRDK